MAVHASVAARRSFSSSTPEVAAPFSLESLYREFGPWILQICRQRLGNHADAEDACQDTILKAFTAMARFRKGARLSPWLATIAMNTCTDIQRRQARLDPLDEAADEEALDLEEETFRTLRQQLVREALPFLPENYRNYIYLRDFDDWSYEQIGRFYGVSVASVRSTLLRARRLLREEVKRIAEEKGQWPLPAFVPSLWMKFRSYVHDRTVRARDLLASAGSRLGSMSPLESGFSGAFIAGTAAVATVISIAVGISLPGTPVSAQSVDPREATTAALLSREPGLDGALSSSSPTLSSAEADTNEALPNETSATTGESSLETETWGSQTDPDGTSAQAEAGQASVSVVVGNPSHDEDSTEAPPVSASADLNGDQDPDAGMGGEPTQVSCPPPEERGPVTGVACPVVEESEEAIDDLTSAVEDAVPLI